MDGVKPSRAAMMMRRKDMPVSGDIWKNDMSNVVHKE
jgi:hypothetical protein